MIIADDEDIVREGLRNIIDWESFEIEVIAEAADGQEAYELCEKLHPDILLTDIRMPLMDGLEVAINLKEQKSDIRIIIISGVQDFNYAKTALDINAEGYILKPIKINELKEVFRRVTNTIKKERNRDQEINN
jgi:two-component system response regulator YesN